MYSWSHCLQGLGSAEVSSIAIQVLCTYSVVVDRQTNTVVLRQRQLLQHDTLNTYVYMPVGQLVERLPSTQNVAGSNPT